MRLHGHAKQPTEVDDKAKEINIENTLNTKGEDMAIN